MIILLHEYARYNLWANDRFIARLTSEPGTILDAPVASSFPSLRRTLLHIRDAESAWTCRLRNEAVPWPAEPSLEIDSLLRPSERLYELVLAYDEGDLQEQREYRTLKGDPQRSVVWRMLHHCFNHSTQHRGQLITMMRGLGLEDIPSNDLVIYQRTLTA